MTETCEACGAESSGEWGCQCDECHEAFGPAPGFCDDCRCLAQASLVEKVKDYRRRPASAQSAPFKPGDWVESTIGGVRFVGKARGFGGEMVYCDAVGARPAWQDFASALRHWTPQPGEMCEGENVVDGEGINRGAYEGRNQFTQHGQLRIVGGGCWQVKHESLRPSPSPPAPAESPWTAGTECEHPGWDINRHDWCIDCGKGSDTIKRERAESPTPAVTGKADPCGECERPLPDYPPEHYHHKSPICADCHADLIYVGIGVGKVSLDDRIAAAKAQHRQDLDTPTRVRRDRMTGKRIEFIDSRPPPWECDE